MIASQNGNIEVLDTLIKHGANVDLKKEVNLYNLYNIIIISYSYMIAASGLWSIHEWLSSDRARGRSPSGLSKLKPRVYTP